VTVSVTKSFRCQLARARGGTSVITSAPVIICSTISSPLRSATLLPWKDGSRPPDPHRMAGQRTYISSFSRAHTSADDTSHQLTWRRDEGRLADSCG